MPDKYAVHAIKHGYRMVKFVEDEPAGFYDMVYHLPIGWRCNCPSEKLICKHLIMLGLFKKLFAVDTGRQYCPEYDEWYAGVEIDWLRAHNEGEKS